MTIPNKYLTGSDVLVNYDFTDILTNQGYITLFGIIDEADSAIFTRLGVDSSDERIEYTSTASDPEGETNIDYEFLVPIHMKGDLFLTVTYFAQATATQSSDCQLNIRILHYDGSTETVIGASQSTEAIVETEDTSTEYKRATLTFTDMDRKFKRGEILRVEVEVTTTNSTNAKAGFYMDGGNRDYGQEDPTGTSVDSTFICQIPLKLDI